jgi:hypothetical protein
MKRASRMRELIGKACEFAQQAMRELFPVLIWLAHCPNGGHLWGYTTGRWWALRPPCRWPMLTIAEGRHGQPRKKSKGRILRLEKRVCATRKHWLVRHGERSDGR